MVKKFLLTLFLFLAVRTPAQAYFNGMSASVVIGQTDFVFAGAGNTSQALRTPGFVHSDGKKFYVTDTGNHRVLIYNKLPLTTNQAADVVVGQSNMSANTPSSTSATLSCGFNFVNSNDIQYNEGAATSDGVHLIVTDAGNNRVLIYNSIPTKNGQCPNVVVGQPDLVSNNNDTAHNALDTPNRAFMSNGKLFIVDQQNSRVLIFNALPTKNNANADVVVGNTSFTDNSTGRTQNRFNNPHSAVSDGTHLVVADSENHRVLIYNTIPTKNGSNADVVLGQTDFTSDTSDPNIVTANSIGYPEDVFIDNKHLYVVDATNNRIMIWNTIPTTNNQAADIVIGQDDFVSSYLNPEGITTYSLSNPGGIFVGNNQLYVADKYNNRVLAFTNVTDAPGIELENAIYDGAHGKSRMKGSAYATVDGYNVQNVSYSVNGGPVSNATPFSGQFSDVSENFFFDFDQKANNNSLDGFTVSVMSYDQNNDVSDKAFYFQPFTASAPPNMSYTTNPLPTFEFNVNKQLAIMSTNIDSYVVQVKQDGGEWQTYGDYIPVDFFAARNSPDIKIKAEPNGASDSDNGVYETDTSVIEYSEHSSRIRIHLKDPSHTNFTAGGSELSGIIQWKISAIDKAGHYQDSSINTLRIGTSEVDNGVDRFPLAVLTISGVQDPHISTYDLEHLLEEYQTSKVAPTFFGIANVGAKVTLTITNQQCNSTNQANCQKTYTTTANETSRFGINIPKGDLSLGNTYTIALKAEKDGSYNELPTFNLHTSAQDIGLVAGAHTNIPYPNPTQKMHSSQQINH